MTQQSASTTTPTPTSSSSSKLDEPQWFACQCNPLRLTTTLRTQLEKQNIEHYIATRPGIRKLGDRIIDVEEPLLGGIFFVKSTLRNALALKFHNGLDYNYIRDGKKQLLVVPQAQLDNFIKVINVMKDKVNYQADYYAIGDKVIVSKGKLCGVTGTLIRANEKDNILIIKIDGVAAISVKVGKSYLKKIG